MMRDTDDNAITVVENQRVLEQQVLVVAGIVKKITTHPQSPDNQALLSNLFTRFIMDDTEENLQERANLIKSFVAILTRKTPLLQRVNMPVDDKVKIAHATTGALVVELEDILVHPEDRRRKEVVSAVNAIRATGSFEDEIQEVHNICGETIEFPQSKKEFIIDIFDKAATIST